MYRLFSAMLFVSVLFSCEKKNEESKLLAENVPVPVVCSVDSTAISAFFEKFPELIHYQTDVLELYRNRSSCIWYDGGRLIEYAHVLHSRLAQISDEGLPETVPYQNDADLIFSNHENEPDTNSELLLSSLYFYYTCNVFGGLDAEKSRENGWFLPREKVSYVSHLDTLIKKKEKGDPEFFAQYYNLRKALKKYREIEKKGGWERLEMDSETTKIKPGDSSGTARKLRTRLYFEGYLANDSGSFIFDKELSSAINAFLEANVRNPEKHITPKLLEMLNVPVSERIRTISVNMERCRWINPELSKAKDYVAVNIPSFRLHYFREGKPILISRVVVGKELNETVVFSGQISYIAFSPYWNIPDSILENEILPALKKDAKYLNKHNMEWNGERVRQKPGGKNSLGLVKFMFPNENNIYLHDTPAKSLFGKEGRAFSHGCVRVEKARELAITITQSDGGWTEKQVDEAMNSGKENYYVLKNKLPVYIAYFTAWADENGNIAFFDDVYKRDQKLAELLYKTALK